MKRAMKQSTLTLILNGISILALLFLVFSLFSYSGISRQLNDANEERFELTYNANRFMNGSAYLTNEVRALPPQACRNIMTITGRKLTSCKTGTRVWQPCRRSALQTRSRT